MQQRYRGWCPTAYGRGIHSGAAVITGCNDTRTKRHAAMGHRGSVFNYQHPLVQHEVRLIDRNLKVRSTDRRIGIEVSSTLTDFINRSRCCSVRLADHQDIRAAEIDLARKVVDLVPGAQGVHYHDIKVGPDKGKVIVAAVPHYQVHIALRLVENGLVVDPCIDGYAHIYVGFVFFAFLNCAIMLVKVFRHGKTLYPL